MKHLAFVFAAAMAFPGLVFAQSPGCEAKRQALETELAYAQAHGNTAREQGLRTALSHVESHCTEESLRSAAQQKVAKAQAKLAEREHDLQQAKDQGKSPKKIADRQRKVDEAHEALEKAMLEA
ncbi:DUF1090 domain-containing protein [Dyella sp.]|uniref:DUF1090 domain-containing protein n=1 Tax=Dyella sp. TaxID=1869338 RepID=UPI002ED01F98